ncbi:hypothetical protein DEU56DRAFT_984935 [Suillus clintonianus]|uniref:uncharacterized protein n=1 Tax=Suillus clintonianus TaxID=1904413 RepID=UPI001B879099|nr:uncharacterized protein DEU56DRAFT_984935 [Suillus clintonianus]KAG2116397.1 hypothetical protein DEU56DRAFT_984935 [Suillus clintonianus]
MQLSLVLTTLMALAAIAAAYPTPDLGMVERRSLAKREELESGLIGDLNARLPEQSNNTHERALAIPASGIGY